jgi:hypothetical protein
MWASERKRRSDLTIFVTIAMYAATSTEICMTRRRMNRLDRCGHYSDRSVAASRANTTPGAALGPQAPCDLSRRGMLENLPVGGGRYQSRFRRYSGRDLMQSDAPPQLTNPANVVYLSDIRKRLSNDTPPKPRPGAAAARQYQLEFVQAIAMPQRVAIRA